MSGERDGHTSAVAVAVGVSAILLLAGSLPPEARAAETVGATVTPNVAVADREAGQLIEDFESPSLTVDPTDPDRVVVAYRKTEPDYDCFAAYSRDGGRSWGASQLPSPPAGTCWSPSVAFGPDGRVYLATQNRPPGGGAQNIIVYTSTNGGETFAEPVAIPDGAGFQAGVAVDIHPDSPHVGRVYVAWYNFPLFPSSIDVYLSYSDDGGASWTSPVTARVSGQYQTHPSVAVTPDGSVYVVYKDINGCPAGQGVSSASSSPGQCSIWVARSSDGGDSFDGNFLVDTVTFDDFVAGEAPGIAAAPNGNVLVTWAALPDPPLPGDEPHPDPDCPSDDYDIFVARSTDRGQSWQQAQVPNSNGAVNDDPCGPGNQQYDPWVDVAPDGRVDVVFYDTRNDPDNVLMDVYHTASNDGGVSFTPNRRVTDRSFDARQMFTPTSAGFQSTEFDRMNGVVSLDDVAITAWGDARNTLANSPDGDPDTSASDVFTARIELAGDRVRPTRRIGGGDRYETAAHVSRETFSFADTVAIASGETFPDALAGGPLARQVRGPILLTPHERLPDVTAAEIERLSPSTVLVFGGTAVISGQVEDQLRELGVEEVVRLAGADRYATAGAIAERYGPPASATALIVSGQRFPDGVAASAYGAFRRMPVLLVQHDDVPEATSRALADNDIEHVIVVGGKAAVSEQVVDRLQAGGYEVTRVAGADRWTTSAALAAHGVDPKTERLPLPVNVVYLATGRDFPDTLTAAPAVAYRGGLLLLADGDDPSAGFLDAHREHIDQTIGIGGCRTASLQPLPGFQEPVVC